MNPTPAQFTFSRQLHAPRDLVFQVWTQAEHLSKWFGPKGTKSTHVSEFDFRPGGRSLYSLQGSEGGSMWGLWVFQEINPPEDFSFLSSFSDETGTVQPAPFDMDWPFEIYNKVTFTEQDGGTLVTLAGGPINATPAQQKVFTDMTASMEGGWGGTFDELEEYLRTL